MTYGINTCKLINSIYNDINNNLVDLVHQKYPFLLILETEALHRK